MTFNLQRFRIEGLHGTRTIDIPITDNKLILVGENGAGKSTVANFIYFFLTRQWWRMWQYQFDSLSVVMNNREFNITKTEITIPSEEFLHLTRRAPSASSRALRDLRNYMVHRTGEDSVSLEILLSFIQESEIPLSVLRQIIERENDMFSLKIKEYSTYLQSEFLDQQVLYLPTYRRIEKELEAILQKGQYEDARYRRTSALEQPILTDPDETDFIELVEFGMKDVEQRIDQTMSRLKDDLTNSLNNLTGTYLREVVLGTYQSVDKSGIDEINADRVRAILSRVGEDLLSSADKEQIIERIERNIHLENDVVAHFLIRLNELYKLQQEREKNVKEFVDVSNKYLKGKKLVYDNIRYRIEIYHTQSFDNSSPVTESKIRWRDLSSGEKQIVSLFAHIYLSGKSGYLVIIDEPELSLSVPWQKDFLPDILRTEKCTGIIAVTHSPFIFSNELKPYVYSLEDYLELKQ